MKRKKGLIAILLILVLLIIGSGIFLYNEIKNNQTSPYYLASKQNSVIVFDKDANEIKLVRGTLLDIKNKKVKIDDIEYCQFNYDGKTYYVKEENLSLNREDCVLETDVYALRNHVLTNAFDDYHINGFIFKQDNLKVTGYHELLDDGSVDYYYVNDTGYIDSKYVANEYYETQYDGKKYSNVFYGMGGDPTIIDYYPKEETNFVNNKMPEVVKALYINAEAIADAESFIEVAKGSNINAFVVDIKDCYIDTQLAYDSPAMKIYAPSTSNIPNSLNTYKENMKLLKDAGFYLIGRITAFKDDSFAKDNPNDALLYNGNLYRYGGVNWPSVYSFKMWEYNLALASEAVELFGFNEIQFDYIRFPEDADESIEYKNEYNLTRSQIVTEFLRYAVEYLHKQDIYVSADVFGETSGDDNQEFSCFVAYYGQFWPAISNTVDVISSMPYPDHFGSYYFGIAEPWIEPINLMTSWAKATKLAQDMTYDQAKCRTWIMAQNSDVYEIEYTADYIKQQIDGLKAGGVYDGFMTWNAASSLNKYYQYIDVLD